jgi:hypothetical protein
MVIRAFPKLPNAIDILADPRGELGSAGKGRWIEDAGSELLDSSAIQSF